MKILKWIIALIFFTVSCALCSYLQKNEIIEQAIGFWLIGAASGITAIIFIDIWKELSK